MINREEFIRKLESVQPGLAQRETVEQANCLVFYRERIHAFNDEIHCHCPSGFDKTARGAVPAAKLLEQLQKWQEDEIGIDFTEAEVLITGKGQRAGIRMEREITLPIRDVEKPTEWRELPAQFAEAVNVAQQCASKSNEDFKKTCVNLHPRWIEAWDNHQIARYKLKTGLKEPVLVRQQSIKHVVSLGMTHFSETAAWLHFKNANGLVLSCRRYVDEFPSDDLTKYLDLGEKRSKAQLPKGLAEAAEKAAVFTSEAEADLVRVKLKPGKAWVKGTGVSGWYERGPMRVTYDGPRLEFLINPKLLSDIVTKHAECELVKDRMLIPGGAWSLVLYLMPPEEESNGEAAESVEEHK